MLNQKLVFVCVILLELTLFLPNKVHSQDKKFTRADRLRGSVTPERAWWDLKHYDLSVSVFPDSKSLKGTNVVSFECVQAGQKMQIDLQEPLKITKVEHAGEALEFEREGNAYWIQFKEELAQGVKEKITIDYEGVPVESTRPPWEGGLTWSTDEKGHPFITTTCQGVGASIWWPNKDHGYDEPDDGMDIRVRVPSDLTAVANGRLVNSSADKDNKTKTYHWTVTHPINNYCVNLNIGNYVNFSEKYKGEGGQLDMDYWVLAHQKERAKTHFKEAPRTLAAFEHWFGKYPFYEDSYKLVAVPYPGMEHQSSVTYGNGFKNGYRGRDLSDTGIGFKFDFIIVHESGHEWFGNNISMKDAADMWIHESFTNYSENLFVEYHFTEKEAQDYVIGCRALVKNDIPIIGNYNLNSEGSGDMYYKGGNMLHTIRHIIHDDKKWREILRGLNRDFWHQTVTTAEIEYYMIKKSGIDLSSIFDQYLRSTMIPKLKYTIDGSQLEIQAEEVVDGFATEVLLRIDGTEERVKISSEPTTIEWPTAIKKVELDRNFYMTLEKSS